VKPSDERPSTDRVGVLSIVVCIAILAIAILNKYFSMG
jgi:hypothetical protein